jgi:putative (di)nucleoside polyphosphate hydrolase
MTSLHSLASMDLSRFRPNVGIVLIGRDGKVWLGRRADTAGPLNWQFPQGGVDEGEALDAAALRELREETGVTSVSVAGRTRDWMAYVFPPVHARSKAARGWLGQKQVWFALRFLGDDREIDLGAHNHAEFDAWRWADIDETLDTVVDFKRDIYSKVVAEFRPLAVPHDPAASRDHKDL